MKTVTPSATRSLTIIAQDPTITDVQGKVLLAEVSVPQETLGRGPKGYRIEVIDYDVSTQTFYTPAFMKSDRDFFADTTVRGNFSKNFLTNPHFHAQNVYAIAMATLGRFERALGRTVSWNFDYSAHHLKIAPHAFAEPNAYYSREDHGLMFGYFFRDGKKVFTCLSHDIIAHETTHAILDGLRPYYIAPSSPDQLAFHEGFADVVALLSVLATPTIVNHALGSSVPKHPELIYATQLTTGALKKSFLLGLADQMGNALSGVRAQALRASAKDLEPGQEYYDLKQFPSFSEPHRRGEILVAAIINAYLRVWETRVKPLVGIQTKMPKTKRVVDRKRAVEEGVNAAEHLLNIAIRAIDYLPPVDLRFPDYLSAILTADAELCRDDSKYHYRHILLECFQDFGIRPHQETRTRKEQLGQWDSPRPPKNLNEGVVHLAALQNDLNTAFRWVWENRHALELEERAFTRVLSVRPITRVGPDRYILRETVVEVLQTLLLHARELPTFKLDAPTGMRPDHPVTLHGGNTLVFDEFGRLKFNIGSGVSSLRQQEKISYLWERGYYSREEGTEQTFARLHINRMMNPHTPWKEQW